MRVNAVLGMAQSGKTTLAERLTRKAPRRLILDPVLSRPFRPVDGQRFDRWETLARFLASEEAEGGWTAFLQSTDEADYVNALAGAPYYRHVTLFVDEALWFTGQKELRERLVKVSRANAHFGGGLGVPLWLTAQRPMDLPADIRSQVDQAISFVQTEPRDLGYLAERFSPEFAGRVQALRGHDWLAFPELTKGSNHGTDGGSGSDRRSVAADRVRPLPGGELPGPSQAARLDGEG